jgi:hypothetical protein
LGAVAAFSSVVIQMDDNADGYSTPELAAMSGWADTPAARARVISTTMHGDDSAEVIIDTEPSHPMHTRVERHADGLWRLDSDWA